MHDDAGEGYTRDFAHARHPGFHKTATIDYAIVLTGEIYALMDEGEALMRARDVLCSAERTTPGAIVPTNPSVSHSSSSMHGRHLDGRNYSIMRMRSTNLHATGDILDLERTKST